jgi:hypothetical protein
VLDALDQSVTTQHLFCESHFLTDAGLLHSVTVLLIIRDVATELVRVGTFMYDRRSDDLRPRCHYEFYIQLTAPMLGTETTSWAEKIDDQNAL